ncbi:unnamed protein product [Sympodiomycopsis kandeliae]
MAREMDRSLSTTERQDPSWPLSYHEFMEQLRHKHGFYDGTWETLSRKERHRRCRLTRQAQREWGVKRAKMLAQKRDKSKQPVADGSTSSLASSRLSSSAMDHDSEETKSTDPDDQLPNSPLASKLAAKLDHLAHVSSLGQSQRQELERSMLNLSEMIDRALDIQKSEIMAAKSPAHKL